MQPEHVAIIMDGNGRWAKRRGLPRTAGHKQGAEAVRRTVRHARRRGIRCLTLFAFSTLNWARPALEVRALMVLLERFLRQERQELLDNGIRLRAIGEIDSLPKRVLAALNEVMDATAHLRGMDLVLALSYDGRRDLVRAAQRLTGLARDGQIDPDDVDEDTLADALSTSQIPDVDLLVRTSGERRLSGFLPFEACYAELQFVDAYWPDFDEQLFDDLLSDFGGRERRFGRTGEQIAAVG